MGPDFLWFAPPEAWDAHLQRPAEVSVKTRDTYLSWKQSRRDKHWPKQEIAWVWLVISWNKEFPNFSVALDVRLRMDYHRKPAKKAKEDVSWKETVETLRSSQLVLSEALQGIVQHLAGTPSSSVPPIREELVKREEEIRKLEDHIEQMKSAQDDSSDDGSEVEELPAFGKDIFTKEGIDFYLVLNFSAAQEEAFMLKSLLLTVDVLDENTGKWYSYGRLVSTEGLRLLKPSLVEKKEVVLNTPTFIPPKAVVSKETKAPKEETPLRPDLSKCDRCGVLVKDLEKHLGKHKAEDVVKEDEVAVIAPPGEVRCSCGMAVPSPKDADAWSHWWSRHVPYLSEAGRAASKAALASHRFKMGSEKPISASAAPKKETRSNDPLLKKDPLGAGPLPKHPLSDYQERKLRNFFGLSLDPIPAEAWNRMSKEEKEAASKQRRIPAWARMVVSKNHEYLEKVLSGIITKDNASQVPQATPGQPRPRSETRGKKAHEAEASWVALRDRYRGTRLLLRPSSNLEKAFKKKYDELIALYGQQRCFPKPQARPGSPGRAESRGRQSSAGSGGDFSHLVQLSEVLGTMMRNLRGT
jgi:hypothetical protein